jgi:MFS family permease
MTRPSAFAPFRIRSYRFQWPADLLTSWAFEMEALILGWYVLVETNSVLLLTVYGALLYGGTLIAPMMGVASDRIGHRNFLSGMRAIYALVAGTLMTVAFAGALNPYVVLVLAAIAGLVRPSDLGLRGALIAETMPADRLTAAMGISRTTSDSARIMGALVGAGLFALLGLAPAYIVVTGFYVASAVLTRFAVPTPGAAPVLPDPAELGAPTSPWRDLKEGIVHVWNKPGLLAVVWFALLFNFTAFSITQGLLPYVAREVYATDQTGLGYLVASIAVGAVIGALFLSSSAVARLPRLMIVSAVIWHILLLVFAQTQTLATGMMVLILVGLAQSLAMVSHSVILLQEASQRFRGRVLGVRMLAIYTLPLGLVIAGVLTERIGFAATMTLYASIGLVFTAVIGLRWRATASRER